MLLTINPAPMSSTSDKATSDTSSPLAKPTATSAIGGAARALLQTSVHFSGDGVARGCQAEQDARRSRHEKRESQHARIRSGCRRRAEAPAGRSD